jgi:hypothetical protein
MWKGVNSEIKRTPFLPNASAISLPNKMEKELPILEVKFKSKKFILLYNTSYLYFDDLRKLTGQS